VWRTAVTRLAVYLASIVLLPALAAAPSPAAPVAPPPREVILYFPTTVGTKWTYQETGGGTTSYVITAVEREGNVWVVSQGELDAKGRVSLCQTMEVSARGVFCLESAVRTYSSDGRGGTAKSEKMLLHVPPACLLKLPATRGEKWDATFEEYGKVSYKTGREEEVKVPAGVFRAVPVECEPKDGGRWFRGRMWYAPAVGEVKWVGADGSESVLKTISPGKQQPATGGP
jgi:hypothetical protein